MNVAVFGATGDTGQHVVDEALDAGHEVRAFVRTRSKLKPEHLDHDRVSIVDGDALDPDVVGRAIEGTDAVLSALGHAEGSPDEILTIAGEHITTAMEAYDVPRLVILAGAGVRHPKDPFSLGGRAMSAGLKLVAGDFLDDTKQYVKEVVQSDTEWVVVRPPRLTNGPRTGEYRMGYLKLGPRATISRADVAAFMVEQVVESTYVGEAPMIAD